MEKILVIDDDEKILELVQEVLKNEHYIVETRSYVDNTNIGEFEGFDLILLDIMLPFLDGYEILERIKNIITCPVIFLSAKSSEGAKVKTLDEYYDLIEIYKDLDSYDKEMIWSIMQTVKKVGEKRKKDNKLIEES